MWRKSKNDPRTPVFVTRLTGCQSALYAFIHSLLGGADGAGDVLQETNIALWNKAGDYDPAKPFLPWAYTFARFQVMAWRKKQSRSRLVLDDELLDQVAAEFECAGHRPERELEALESCLSNLPAGQRAIVDARYADGEAVRDMALRMGKGENVVAASLYRIRKALMECVRERLKEVEP